MAEKQIQYVTKTTPDITQEQIERLKEVFPECVSEGRIDFERLRATLGDVDALAGDNTYSFTWAGKQEAFRAIQTPSAASLAPATEESVNWDTTQHLFIEGENLEVLKLLYKSYFGKVKMIYIDPPYNTGNDFIYRDDYRQPHQAYLEKTGQTDAEGNLLRSNPETSGRYHSDWLSMMYPRLFLARQLLREDGVIMVSIDDYELHNLRLLMNEIFGEENHLSNLVWDLRSGTSAGHFTRAHEYVVAYAKSKSELPNFPSQDDTPITGRTTIRPSKLNPMSRIDFPAGMEFEGTEAVFSGTLGDAEPVKIVSGHMVFENGKLKHPVTLESAWRMRDQMISWINGEETLDSKGQRVISIYFNKHGVPWYKKERGFVNPKSVVRAGSTKDGTMELEEIFGSRVMPFPKPSALMKYLTSIPLKPNESAIVLDFFAGSCTTAQAVLQLNREDDGNRRFVMVQFPEPTPEDSVAGNEGFKTIADIGKERIRRAIAQMEAEGGGKRNLRQEEDSGFKVFKLAPSTFRQWEPPPGEGADALAQQLSFFDHGLEEGADPLHVIYEVILKEGYSLNARIELLDLDSSQVYRVTEPEDEGHFFYICLDDDVRDSTLGALSLDKETVFICLDTALDDSQKVNLSMQCLLKVI